MIQRRQLLQAGACTAVIGMPALAQTKYRAEYRLSLVVGAGTNWHFAAERFANLVREKTQGRLNFKLYPGSSLVQGQQDRELTALRRWWSRVADRSAVLPRARSANETSHHWTGGGGGASWRSS